MKPGRSSQTAVYVCAARALAHGMTSVASFSDPTALVLLPEAARARVERIRAAGAPKSLRQKLARAPLDTRAKMMVVRTVTVDDAVRAAAAPQLVILGAGLDGRAWRMDELKDVTVFEVDRCRPAHPRQRALRRPRTRYAPPEAHAHPDRPATRVTRASILGGSSRCNRASAGQRP
jgi:methyltransferase (TIGR00027 family)